MVTIGFYALWSNGVSYNSSVSTIICTTQNPDIKQIIADRTLGSQPLAEDIAKTKLRFGIVQQHSGTDSTPDGSGGRIGFGVEGTVTPLPRKR
ncbi:uncharacterized protein K452DRAFT_301987 [Aplosporella prunicola CBS 121167]|uniref:Uncharacterized protein n=1 Tax=Aplosporella prunicola CBS 121167 TaxID=1176127 RepID=A0A6A6AZN3_9PEZI|nr:uncharacterized protein K452DRAFT_301987 [Aplosporella prunicola CBS 121167]KAF2137402.1 hypothetical protein K452DRAFT_301987 [Aplosporella prunicola CBS 121167]